MKKTYELVIPDEGSCGLGDTLISMLTSRTRDDVIYVLPKHAAHLAPLFHDIAPVMVRETVKSEKPVPGNGSLFLRLFPEELANARDRLKKFLKPIALAINCAPHWSHIRECPVEKWNEVVAFLIQRGWTPLQFGTSKNWTPLNEAFPMLDLSVRELAACYNVIGCLAGVDSGDRHLATAVNARVFVAHPSEHLLYSFKMWHYEHPNVSYYHFDLMKEMAIKICS